MAEEIIPYTSDDWKISKKHSLILTIVETDALQRSNRIIKLQHISNIIKRSVDERKDSTDRLKTKDRYGVYTRTEAEMRTRRGRRK